MALEEKEIDELRSGALTVDAFHMLLTQRGSDSQVYSGSGQIQISAGKLAFVCHDREAEQGFGWKHLTVPGRWVEDYELLDFRARDWRGREWTAERVRPDTSHVHGEKGVVCRGFPAEFEIKTKSNLAGGESIWLFFPAQVAIPANAFTRSETDARGQKSYQMEPNIFEVEADDFRVRITKVLGGVEVLAFRHTGCFSHHFDTRLTEALCFLLARPLEWQIRRRMNAQEDRLTIVNRPPPPVEPRILPPLHPTYFESQSSMGSMFLLYLAHVDGYTAPGLHPMSVNIRQTLLASATNIETEALSLGIAVESFVRREYKDWGVPDNLLIANIEVAAKYMKQWEGDPALQMRIYRMISGMKGVNPREAMNKLVIAGILSKEQIDVWGKLRNTTAHGMDFNADYRQVVQWCNVVHGALLRLVFSVIGYSGPYIDRAGEDWPTLHFQAAPLSSDQ